MGILDKSVEQKEFDKFKLELESKLKAIDTKIDFKVTDSEEIAQISATNILAVEKSIKATASAIEVNLEKLNKYTDDAHSEYTKIKEEHQNIETKNIDLQQRMTDVEVIFTETKKSKKNLDEDIEKTNIEIKKINQALTESETLPEHVQKTQTLLEECQTLHENIESLQKHSFKRKSDIDNIYKEINGETLTNHSGETEHIDGLKDALENSYTTLNEKLENLESNLEETISSINESHTEKLEGQENHFEKFLDQSRSRIISVKEQLTDLLPGSMAKGLSAAYEDKKKDEIDYQSKLEKSFKVSITLLVVISLIPFAVDLYLLAEKGSNIVDVIKDTPSLIIAIFPLYFPVLWFAHSSNKKLNLSKRLIEEYTHKSVLGKTFSGLSNQIDSLQGDSAVQDELRTKLLFNLLQVSSENPGKLITDYEKSDHPLMEALENSSKLANSVDTLSKLPGFSSLANKLAVKSEAIIAKEKDKIEQGLEIQEELDAKDSNAS